jgi:DUF971 family protein
MSAPWPVELKVRKGGSALAASFDDGAAYELPAPLLRTMTPSADGRGHGPDSFRPLAIDAGGVTIKDLRPVGRYAVRIVFSDGHDTGLYTWDRLHRIGREKASLEA